VDLLDILTISYNMTLIYLVYQSRS